MRPWAWARRWAAYRAWRLLPFWLVKLFPQSIRRWCIERRLDTARAFLGTEVIVNRICRFLHVVPPCGPSPAGTDAARAALRQQVDDLRGLGPGWHDGEGSAYAASALDWALDALVRLVEGWRLPVPFVYPTVEGNVLAEWSGIAWEVSLLLEPGAERAHVVVAGVEGSASDDDIDLSEPGGRRRLGSLLGRHLAPSQGPSSSAEGAHRLTHG